MEEFSKKVTSSVSSRNIRKQISTLSALVILPLLHEKYNIPFPSDLRPSVVRFLFSPPGHDIQVSIDEVNEVNPIIGDILGKIHNLKDTDPFPVEVEELEINSDDLAAVSIIDLFIKFRFLISFP